MKIQESGENYLETILMLEQKNGSVRSIDIANELEFSKPSVSRAMSILKTAGFITMDKNNQILLTPEGRQKAESVYERHCLLSRFSGRNSGRRPRYCQRRCLPHRARYQRRNLPENQGIHSGT